ncbi:MAG TPA: hypothetical protein VIS99_16645, partial [Terrimicrobiaceae bacterium]
GFSRDWGMLRKERRSGVLAEHSVTSVFSGLTHLVLERRGRPFDHALENEKPVAASQQRVASTFGVRHQTEDIALFIADAGDIVPRSIRVRSLRGAPPGVAIAQQDTTFELKAVEDLIGGKVTTFSMCDRKTKNGPVPGGISKRTIMSFDTNVNMFANKVESAVSNQGAGEQTRLAQYLEAVANADHRAARGGEASYRTHDGREASNCSTAEIISVGKPSWYHHSVKSGKGRFLVPEILGTDTLDRVDGVNTVLVTVRSRKLKNSKFHFGRGLDFQLPLRGDLESIIFDDGIRQKISGNLVELGFVDAAWQVDLNAFSDANATDVFEAKMFHGFGGCSALRVEHGGFRHHGDNGFHEERISCLCAAHKPIMALTAEVGDRKLVR